MIEGVDLYEGNSFSPALAPGVSFVFLKASEGAHLTDSAFVSRWSTLAGGSTVRGAYHFPSFPNAPADDFAHFESIVGPRLLPGDLVALDFEDDHSGVSMPQATAWKNSFLALTKARWPHNQVGMYCDLSWWHGTDDNCGDFLWLAEPGVSSPGVVHPWTFWQYASDTVDHDRANFASEADLRAWALAPSLPPSPAPVPVPPSPEDLMPAFQTGEVKPGFLCDASGVVRSTANATVIIVPPAMSGGLPWGPEYLSLGCDFGQATIRVAIHDGTWAIQTVTVADTEARLSIPLPTNVGKISLGRVPLSPTDTADSVPVSWLIEAGTRP